MDPNEALRRLLAGVSKYEDTVGNARGPHIDGASEMRDAAVALDEWLSNGGFLPAAWSAKR